MDTRILDVAGLQGLIDVLRGQGWQVQGPVVRDGAVVLGPVDHVSDLPAGRGDEQGPGRYRLHRRDDGLLFGYACAAQSAKPVVLPAREPLWHGDRTPDGVDAAPDDPAPDERVAILGLRACDLAAVDRLDAVLLHRRYADPAYADRRARLFVVAVTCSHPGGTCFCADLGTGPRPHPDQGAFDLCLTEVLEGRGHRFVVDVGSARGADVLTEVEATGRRVPDAGRPDLDAADAVVERARDRMGHRLDPSGLRDLLYGAAESGVWDEVASRCLACGNCTAVCPTCFCTDVRDVTDLSGDHAHRERVWDSCFSAEYSYLHGGSVRASTRSRYRQWLTHKLAAWQDQFGSQGCVGCGRCITWCPAGIDLTEEVAALRERR